jgi:hypothetical protein
MPNTWTITHRALLQVFVNDKTYQSRRQHSCDVQKCLRAVHQWHYQHHAIPDNSITKSAYDREQPCDTAFSGSAIEIDAPAPFTRVQS